MTTTLLLLAAFLAIVVVGATLVAVYDAVERFWTGNLAAVAATGVRPRTEESRSPRTCRPGTPVVAWSHLH
jgi:hypothetical protein